MRRLLTVFATITAVLIATYVLYASISISTTTPYAQNFDGIGTAATASLPADFRVDKVATVRTVGTFASAATATAFAGGANLSSSASNGIYNFGAGTTATGPDRAVGFLSSGTATQSGNLYAQLINNTGLTLAGLQISYNIEKYRGGTNAAGFRIQLFYSMDGSVWTSAGNDFLTSFAADGTNAGFATAPGATVTVNKILSVAVPSGSNFYLAWNYSVASGTTTTNAQALAIDDISILGVVNITGIGGAAPSSTPAGTSTLLTVAVTPGANPTSTGIAVTGNLSAIGGSAAQPFFDDGTHGDATAGDNTFSFSAAIPDGTATGGKTLPVTIADAQQRSFNTSIGVTVQLPPPPTGAGAATPSLLRAGNSTLLTVSVTPGSFPTSTGLTVSGDLSAIGGSSSQVFFDDGTHGDAVANDRVFSFRTSIPLATSPGAKAATFTVADDQHRQTASSITLTIELSSTVRISQVYGGGGNSGATYTNDFIELFNSGTAPVDLTGWSVQETSASATSWTANGVPTALSGVIQPGGYYLVKESQGGAGTTDLPTADATGVITMGASSGKVALVADTAPLAGACPSSAAIVDLVGYGATCFEGAPTPSLDNTTAAVRRGNGCQDTDNNSADFVETGAIPRSSSAPPNMCGGDPALPSGLGIASPDSIEPATNTLLTVKVSPATTPPSTDISVTANLLTVGGTAAQRLYDDGTHGDAIAGDNIFSVEQRTSAALATGAYYAVATVADAQGRTASVPITLTIQSLTCGVERWFVKVGTDSTVGDVRLDIPPTETDIAALGAVRPPAEADIDTGGPFATKRDAPVETTVFSVDGYLWYYKKETDVDYHLVIGDAPSETEPDPTAPLHAHTVIAEIPNPGCVIGPNPNGPGNTLLPSPLAAGIANARSQFDARIQAQTFFNAPALSIPVRVKGVGFFDFAHGQRGLAPNAIELHPVLSLTFRANTTTTLLSSGTPTYGDALTFTATVTNADSNSPTGDVTFFDSLTGASATATLHGGEAVFSTTTLGAGAHSILASYSGDDTSLPSTSAALPFTVAKADQAIDFAALAGRTYGDAPFAVGASGGASGNAVTFTASGDCALTSGTLTITDAGSCSVTASQSGNDNYNAAADVTRSFDIGPASLSATANDASREFGAPNPLLGGTLVGVVNGDGITASFTTGAGPASPVGAYAIVPVLSDPNARLRDYVVSSHDGVLTVVDTTPPAIGAVTTTPSSIWPPNKQMVPVSIAVAVTDAADPSPVCRVTSVSSSEPAADDSAITGPLTVSLRADRNGDGTGRIYTIAVRCVDASGNASTSSTTVSVPHDQR